MEINFGRRRYQATRCHRVTASPLTHWLISTQVQGVAGVHVRDARQGPDGLRDAAAHQASKYPALSEDEERLSIPTNAVWRHLMLFWSI